MFLLIYDYLITLLEFLLQVKTRDYIRLQLKGSTFFCQVRASRTSAAKLFGGNLLSNDDFCLNDSQSDFKDAVQCDILKPVYITEVSLEVFGKSDAISLELNSEKSKLFFILSGILRDTGLVSHMILNMSIHKRAKVYGICKIKVGRVVGFDKEANSKVIITKQSPYIGFLRHDSSPNENKIHNLEPFHACDKLLTMDAQFQKIQNPYHCNEIISSEVKSSNKLKKVGGVEKILSFLDEHQKMKLPSKRIPIIIGPVGYGKRSAIHSFYRNLNIMVIEIDASVKNLLETLNEKLRKTEKNKVVVYFRNYSNRNSVNVWLRNSSSISIVLTAISRDDIKNSSINFFPCVLTGSTRSYRIKAMTAIVSSHEENVDSEENILVLPTKISWPSQKQIETICILSPGFMGADLDATFEMALDKVREELNKEKSLISNPTFSFSDRLNDNLLKVIRNYTPAILKNNPRIERKPEYVELGGMEDMVKVFKYYIDRMIEGGSSSSREYDDMVRGAILYGPPGCGKTQFACYLANSQGCTFINVTPANILSSYVGDTSKNLR